MACFNVSEGDFSSSEQRKAKEEIKIFLQYATSCAGYHSYLT
jgi:hypothetical protein